MDRRVFLSGSAALFAVPLAAVAQQAGKVAKIGYLTGSSVGPLDVFTRAMGEHGYIAGRNLVIESRSAEGRSERLPLLPSNWLTSISMPSW